MGSAKRFSHSWHVTGLWQPKSICSPPPPLPVRLHAPTVHAPIGGGWRQTITFGVHSSRPLKKEAEKNKKQRKESRQQITSLMESTVLQVNGSKSSAQRVATATP